MASCLQCFKKKIQHQPFSCLAQNLQNIATPLSLPGPNPSVEGLTRREPTHPLNHKFPDFSPFFRPFASFFLSSLRMGLTILYNSLPEQTFFRARADRFEMVPFEEGMLLPNCPHIAYPSLALRTRNQGGVCRAPCPSNHNQGNHTSFFLLSVMVNLLWQHKSMGTLFCATDVYFLWR